LSLKGESILSLQLEQWTDVWRNRHHIMSRLAKDNRVLFASPPFYVRSVSQNLLSRNAPHTGLSSVSNGLYTYIPPKWLPFSYRHSKLTETLKQFRLWHMKKTMHRLEMRQPILYIWYPSLVDVVGHLDESLIVYHCYDEYASFTDQTKAEAAEIIEQEERLLRRADIVFASSEELGERKRRFNSNTHVVRNAVDYPLFAAARSPTTKVPEDLREIPGPIIGCVSAVTHYVDVDLLHKVFAKRSDWSFVFIGNPETPSSEQGRLWTAFKKLPNVHFLGRRELHELPSYLRGFDVCAMPYLITDNVLACDPLKMYEYLASGKPVVSMPLPLISDLKAVISFARDAAEWGAAIENALNENSLETAEERQAVARQNTWDQRAAFISAKLANELVLRRRA
jgi:glycosyltransferase involved in cell wall biosynthesis